jgi:hypothetical protein
MFSHDKAVCDAVLQEMNQVRAQEAASARSHAAPLPPRAPPEQQRGTVAAVQILQRDQVYGDGGGKAHADSVAEEF